MDGHKTIHILILTISDFFDNLIIYMRKFRLLISVFLYIELVKLVIVRRGYGWLKNSGRL